MPDRNNGNNSALIYAFQEANQDLISEPNTPAANLLRSVREQEAQFDKLTRELEVERRTVANQLDKVRYGSETASLNSISTTDDSFSWRRSAQNESSHLDESSIDDNRPNSQLIDSCLRALGNQDIMDYSTNYSNGPDHYGSMYNSPSMNGTRSPQPQSRQNGGYSPAVGTPTKNPNYQSPYNYDGYHDDRYPPSVDGSEQYHGDQRYDDQPSPHGSDQYGGAAPRGGYGAPASPQVDRYNDSYRDTQRDILDYDYPTSNMAAIDLNAPPQSSPHPVAVADYRHDDDDGYRGDRGWEKRSDSYDSNAPYDDRDQPYDDRNARSDRDPRGSQETLEMKDPRWRAPDLQEVIEYLTNENEAIVANAAAYLQHLTYGDDAMKNKTRGLGAIPALVELLGNPTREIYRSACGALRNISFGKNNVDNKVAIKNAGGIPGLIRLLRSTEDPETHELVTGTLWNLSSVEPLKNQILDDSLTVLTNNVLIPESGWVPDKSQQSQYSHNGIPWSTTFRNATGCFRNISSAGFETRGKMRECHGLVDSLVHVLKGAVMSANQNNEMDNKAVENVVCILRNLSFRIGNEANHPDAITKPTRSPARDSPSKKKGAPPGETSGCFGNQKKKKALAGGNQTNTGTLNKSGTIDPAGPIPERTEPARGSELLWQPDMVKPYLSLLSECSNPITLEAAAGTLQNISAGEWIWGGFVRSQVRKDKGLPVLVELLRMENDRVVAAVARALRNLSVDPRNKELIGKYAMRDLVLRLPGGPASDSEHNQISNDTLTAILNALHEVILRNAENSKSLRDSSGIDRIVLVTKNRANYPPVVVKAAFQVLSTMWSFKDLRPLYKKDGWDECHFTPGYWSKAGSTSATGSPARFNTLPVSGTPKEPHQQRSGSVPVDAGSPYQSATLPASHKPPSYSPGPPRSGEAPPPFESHTYDRRSTQQREPIQDGYSTYGGREYQRADEPYSEMLVASPQPGDRDSLSTYSEGTQQSREEIPMREMPYASVDRREPPPSETRESSGGGGTLRRGPPVGGVPMFGTQMPQPQVAKGDAVYAQVNKDRKSQQYADDYEHSPAPPQINVADAPAGDSWV